MNSIPASTTIFPVPNYKFPVILLRELLAETRLLLKFQRILYSVISPFFKIFPVFSLPNRESYPQDARDEFARNCAHRQAVRSPGAVTQRRLKTS